MGLGRHDTCSGGDQGGRRAARRFGVPFTLSTMSICSIGDVAQHAGAGFGFQLYVMKDRAFIERRSTAPRPRLAACLVLTLDLANPGPAPQGFYQNGLRHPSSPPPPDQHRYQTALGPGHVGHADASLASWAMSAAWRIRAAWPRGQLSSLTRARTGTMQWIKSAGAAS